MAIAMVGFQAWCCIILSHIERFSIRILNIGDRDMSKSGYYLYICGQPCPKRTLCERDSSCCSWRPQTKNQRGLVVGYLQKARRNVAPSHVHKIYT